MEVCVRVIHFFPVVIAYLLSLLSFFFVLLHFFLVLKCAKLINLSGVVEVITWGRRAMMTEGWYGRTDGWVTG